MEAPWLDSDHYGNVLGALVMVNVLALLLERALAVITRRYTSDPTL